MHYYLILALNGFCIYHSIKNKNNYYWIYLILFIPVIGAIIYLVTQVFNKNDANKIQEELTAILVPSKKVKDLEKQLQFSETYKNRVNLADAYFEMEDFNNAIKHYEVALKDGSQKSEHILKQLIKCSHGTGNHEKVIDYSEKIKEHPTFKGSKAQFIYGLSLNEKGKKIEAEKELREIDQRYSNYEERLMLAKFLLENNKEEDAKAILDEIQSESQHMTKTNRRQYRVTILEVERLLRGM